jgi:hypothetical protein
MRPSSFRRPVARSLVVAVASVASLVPLMSAEAAMPPMSEGIVELQMILESPDVYSRLSGEYAAIDVIERVDEAAYRVRAGACSLEVRIVEDGSPNGPGSREFHLDVGDAVCE